MAAPRLNGPFKYRSSVDTDIRRLFKRIQREREAQDAETASPAAAAPAAAPSAVVPMVAPGWKAAR